MVSGPVKKNRWKTAVAGRGDVKNERGNSFRIINPPFFFLSLCLSLRIDFAAALSLMVYMWL